MKNLLDKIKDSWGTKMHNLIFAVCALGLTVLASIFGGAYLPAILGIFAAMANNVAFFLVVLFTFQYFQGGTDLKIQDKIFQDGNIAAAIYQSAIILALALIISGAIL